MTAAALASLLLRLDALANAALAVGALAFREPLTNAAGLSNAWPLGLVALVFVANATLCWRAAGDDAPSPSALRGLAGVDTLFTVGVFGFAMAGSDARPTWLQAVLMGLAIIVATVAAAKLFLAQRLAPPREAVPQR